MEGNVVSAAKWFGFSLIISSVILVVGISMAMNRSSRRISSAIIQGGGLAGSHISIPSNLNLTLRPGGGAFNLDLGNRDSAAFDVHQR
ncbi:MAG: hypothetical protein ACYSOK_00150 [Planctomycetota bacterium]